MTEITFEMFALAVARFLDRHPGRWFAASELADELGVHPSAALVFVGYLAGSRPADYELRLLAESKQYGVRRRGEVTP